MCPNIRPLSHPQLIVDTYCACAEITSAVECFLCAPTALRRRRLQSDLRRKFTGCACTESDVDTLQSLGDRTLRSLVDATSRPKHRQQQQQQQPQQQQQARRRGGQPKDACFTCDEAEEAGVRGGLVRTFFSWFRVPELTRRDQLRKLPYLCRTDHCCNPFHYALISISDDDTPPPYSMYDIENNESISEKNSSHHKNNDNSNNEDTQVWCKFRIYEHKNIVAPRISVMGDYMNIFFVSINNSTIKEDTTNLNLHDVLSNKKSTNVWPTKIGEGLTLWRESNGDVWICNNSDIPLFLCSPSIETNRFHKSFVQRLSPHYCIKAYDRLRTLIIQDQSPYSTYSHHNIDGHSAIVLSFGKGWNIGYTRQCISSCPHWIEFFI